MDGRIWFESPVKTNLQDDKHGTQPGTVFYFTACFRLDQKENEILSYSCNTENMPVLIIDDNKSNRLILKKIMINL